MIKDSIYQEYYSPEIEGGADSSGSASIISKLFTVSDSGVNKVLVDLSSKALAQHDEKNCIVRTDYPPQLISCVGTGSTSSTSGSLSIHIKCAAPTLTKYIWIPLIISGTTTTYSTGEELRLGFDGQGPYYLFTGDFLFNPSNHARTHYHFSITQEPSGDSHYIQYCITSEVFSSLSFSGTSVVLWIPVLRSSVINPTQILSFTENSQQKAMTFTSSNETKLLTERNGYDNDVRHSFRSMVFPPFSVPLAISTVDSSDQTAWNYFDWCQSPYNPTTLQQIANAHSYIIAETDGQSTYLISGIYNGVAELLVPISYHIPLDSFLGAWVVPTSYWACNSGAVGFAPAKNNIATTDDVLPGVIIHNSGVLSVPNTSTYDIPNLLDGYILVLRSDRFGYDLIQGLWKSNIAFINYNEQGIKAQLPSMITYALTVATTSDPEELYQTAHTAKFINRSGHALKVIPTNGQTSILDIPANSQGQSLTVVFSIPDDLVSGQYRIHEYSGSQEIDDVAMLWFDYNESSGRVYTITDDDTLQVRIAYPTSPNS